MLFVMTFLDVLSARFTTNKSVDILDVLEVDALVIERRVALLALDALPSVLAFHVSLKSRSGHKRNLFIFTQFFFKKKYIDLATDESLTPYWGEQTFRCW